MSKKDKNMVSKLVKKYTKIRELILKQLDKEQKLKTIKAKRNAIEKGAENLIELKNIETLILSILDDQNEGLQTKEVIKSNLQDLEERLLTKYSKLF
jgi:hypothetical protein